MLLSIQNLTYRVAGKLLLEGANFTLMPKQHVGLVGANGTGKTTLFGLLTGERAPDAGEVEWAAKLRVGVLKQEVEHLERTILDTVLAADKERSSMLLELETCADHNRMGEIYTRLEDIDAYSAPARAATILAGLGFPEETLHRALSDFSGGWQMRVALAGLLFSAPDLLLLDEPSNHLDFESQIWLEQYLQSYPYSFIMISHERGLLNSTVDTIVHLEHKRLNIYTGNYDRFERLRAEKQRHLVKQHDKQQAERAHMQKFIDRFGASATKAKQAQSRAKMIAKMEMIDLVMAERGTVFNFPEPDDLPSPLINLDNVEVGYEFGKPILKNLGLRIDMDDRIALLGANGNGKSTLIKLLCGELKPMSGTIYKSNKLRIGYFSQHQTEVIDASKTAYQVMKDQMKDAPEPKIRAVLGRFNFDKHKADTKVEELSGGEKSRLLFCVMSYHAPHVLLLDEPTNHLDMDAKEALIQALNNYAGAVIVVTHDPHLVSHVADRLWLVANGSCRPYEGDIEEYTRDVLTQKRQSRKAEKKASKDKQEDSKPSPNKLQQMEKEIARLGAEKSHLETRLATASASSNHADLGHLAQELAAISTSLQQLEEEWLRWS